MSMSAKHTGTGKTHHTHPRAAGTRESYFIPVLKVTQASGQQLGEEEAGEGSRGEKMKT